MSSKVKTSGPTLYEGLFLLNSEAAASDFGGCIEFIRNVFARAGADVKALRKWDERRLAYDIKGQRRGIFILAYFEVDGVQIANIERDCTLSEQILRVLIVRGDHIGEAEIELAQKDADLSLEAQLRAVDDDDDADQGDSDDATDTADDDIEETTEV